MVRYPDGSGQIQLPEGWRITGAHKGMVSASGPHGEIGHGIWTQMMTRAGAASIYASGLAPGTLPIPVADPTDPVAVLQVKWAHACGPDAAAGPTRNPYHTDHRGRPPAGGHKGSRVLP